jgi:hypothetical protein
MRGHAPRHLLSGWSWIVCGAFGTSMITSSIDGGAGDHSASTVPSTCAKTVDEEFSIIGRRSSPAVLKYQAETRFAA